MLRVGINGFGRIGRAIFRNNLEKGSFSVVRINDTNPDIGNIAYTLNFDTLYDRLKVPYEVSGGKLVCGKHEVTVSHDANIDEIDWGDVDVVIDSSGTYENARRAHNLVKAGVVKRVVVTHCPDVVDFTMVLGANESEFDPSSHKVVSSSICDATAIAPVLKVLHDRLSILGGMVTTLHPWLNYQNLMDGAASSWSVPGEIYHHYALGRSAIGNMIPKPTSAVAATCSVLPEELNEDVIGSFSYRTPTAIVGSADLTIMVERKTTKEEIVALFGELEKSQSWSIFHNNIGPLVSLDFKKFDVSATLDHRWTDVKNDRLVKLVLWYDNEWGYAGKVIDQVLYMEERECNE